MYVTVVVMQNHPGSPTNWRPFVLPMSLRVEVCAMRGTANRIAKSQFSNAIRAITPTTNPADINVTVMVAALDCVFFGRMKSQKNLMSREKGVRNGQLGMNAAAMAVVKQNKMVIPKPTPS
jgi:hypothetical protein